jgi:hypothetical protein
MDVSSVVSGGSTHAVNVLLSPFFRVICRSLRMTREIENPYGYTLQVALTEPAVAVMTADARFSEPSHFPVRSTTATLPSDVDHATLSVVSAGLTVAVISLESPLSRDEMSVRFKAISP